MIGEFRKYHSVIPDPVGPLEESSEPPVASAQGSQEELTDKLIGNDAEEVLL